MAATASIPRFQLDVGGHPGADAAGGIVDADFYAEDLVDAFFAGLHVAGQKFGLLVDLPDDTVENLIGEGIDVDFGFLAELDTADHGFRDVDADVNLVAFEQCGDGRIGRNEVARTHVQDLHGRGGRGGDLALAEASFVVSVGSFREFDIFAAVAALEFFESCLRLVVTRQSGSDFFGTVAAFQFVKLVQGILLLREGDLPVGFSGVALLFGNEILPCQGVVAVEVEMRAYFVGFGAVKVGLRHGDVFLAIAVLFQLVIGFGLSGGGAGFGNFLGAITAQGFLGIGAGLLEGRLQFFVVEGDENLPRLNRIAFANENFINAAADFGAHSNVARLDGAGALQAGVAPEPSGVERGRRHGGCDDENNQDALAVHETTLLGQKTVLAV